jgi:para-nitrobenzyl esterase
MMGYWTAFARSGDPNGVGRPDWPRAVGGDTRLMMFRSEGAAATPVPETGRLDLIELFRERPHIVAKPAQVIEMKKK